VKSVLARVANRTGFIPSHLDLPGSKIQQLTRDDHVWKRAALLARTVPYFRSLIFDSDDGAVRAPDEQR
jgi:hypothetical protein